MDKKNSISSSNWEGIEEQYCHLKLQPNKIKVKKISSVKHRTGIFRNGVNYCEEPRVKFIYIYSEEEYAFHKDLRRKK